jgi:hypothetical protein
LKAAGNDQETNETMLDGKGGGGDKGWWWDHEKEVIQLLVEDIGNILNNSILLLYTLIFCMIGCTNTPENTTDPPSIVSKQQSETDSHTYKNNKNLKYNYNNLNNNLPHPGCPNNPLHSLQPTSPGSYWNYKLVLNESIHQCCRMIVIDKWPDMITTAEGVLYPNDAMPSGTHYIKYIITDSLRSFFIPTLGEGYFFKVKLENSKTNQEISLNGEELYMGRISLSEQFGTVLISEFREHGSTDFEELGGYHIRPLIIDCVHIPGSNIMYNAGRLSEDYRFTFETSNDLVSVEVPAGAFECTTTTFTYIFDLYTHRFKAIEKWYYSFGVGLIKRTQTLSGEYAYQESFEMVLESYHINPSW